MTETIKLPALNAINKSVKYIQLYIDTTTSLMLPLTISKN